MCTKVKTWRVVISLPCVPTWKATCFIDNIQEGLGLKKIVRRLNRSAAEKLNQYRRPVKDASAQIKVNPAWPMQWSIIVQLPSKRRCCMSVKADLSAKEAYSRVIALAGANLQERASALYALLNGKHFATVEAPIHALGFHDGCTVEVFYRLRGGVCVSNRDGGRKRGVSASLCRFFTLLVSCNSEWTTDANHSDTRCRFCTRVSFMIHI